MTLDFWLTNEVPYETLVAMQLLSQQLAVKQQNNDDVRDKEETDKIAGPEEA